MVGNFCTGCGTGITGSVSTLGGEYSFSAYGVWCGVVVVIALAFHFVCGFRAAGIVTACGSTLRGV